MPKGQPAAARLTHQARGRRLEAPMGRINGLVMIAAPATKNRHKSDPLRFQDTPGRHAYLFPMSGGFPPPASREQWQEEHSVAKTDTAVSERIPGLRRYARALTGSAADADALVQERLSRATARRKQATAIRTPRAHLL